MGFRIDIDTMITAFIFGNAFTILLITAYLIRSPKDTASIWFAVSKWLQLGAWTSYLFWDDLPRRLIIPLTNLLILCGGCLEMLAVLLMMGMLGRKVKVYYTVLVIGSVLSYVIVALFFNQPNLRIASASFWVMLFVIYPAYLLGAGKEATRLQKMMGAMLFFYAAIMVARGVAAVGEPGMTVFSTNLSQVLYYIGLYLLMIMHNTGFFLLSNERAHVKLKRIATFDELTGTLSRRAFVEQTELKLDDSAKRQERISFLLLDIDHFKQVNDRFGHDIGDTVLKSFAATIRAELHPGDPFGRLGGEEFAILLSGADELESNDKAESLRMAVMNSHPFDISMQYTVSIGVVTIKPQGRADLDKLYKISDKALYEAKQQGRNRVSRLDL